MKKIFFFLAALMLSFTAQAKIVECNPGTNNLAWYLTQGDTLVLADGIYEEAYSIDFNKPGVCVKAAEGAKPVIKLTGEWTVLDVQATTTFEGITFDAGNVAKYLVATTGVNPGTLTINNCEFCNWTYWALSNQFEETASIDSVIVNNTIFHDGAEAAISFGNKAPEGTHSCNYFSLTNSTIYNVKSTEYAGIVHVSSNGEATGMQNKVIIDHVTMYNLDGADLGIIAVRKSSDLTISNTIIANPAAGERASYVYGGVAENVIYYNVSQDGDLTYTNCLTDDPLFVDAANGNFALNEGSPALGAGTDGSNLGDPRWNAPAEPEIEWTPMELEITNLTTEVMEVEGAKYLQLNGRDDMNDADVVLFLNNYTGEDKAYEVNAESSYMTFGGLELAVLEGSMTKAVDTEKGDVYTGVVKASVTDEEEGGTMYIAFDLTMYALPAEELVITNATVTIDENLGTLTFKTTLDDGDYMVELSGYTAPGVHEGPQICLLETPAAVAFGNYAETVVADGVITLTCKGMASFMGAKFDLTISGNMPVKEEPALKGVVKRAVQLGESVVVLTHEADGTAHIYNVVGEKISEVSQEGVIAVDTANAGDYLAISDIAVTDDGKLVAINYLQTQSGDDYVDAGYKRGETRVYLWDNLAGDPSILFTSKMSSNWFRSKQGLTMAVKGTSDNMEIFTTGIHATSAWARVSSYRVINGVYTEPDVNNNDYYHFYDVADAVALETTVGTQYELNASPLDSMNWILDAELINPVEIVEPETNNVEISTCVALTTDLGKKFNGATILKEGEQVLMVAPYADAEGKLAGVKVLDITDGLDADSVVATLDLDAPVAATAAATAVEVAAYDANITLVADGFIYNLVHKLPKPERTETTVLNPFAYNLSSTLSEEGTTLTVNYTLNANADAVEVVILNGEEVVKTIPCKGINKGTYTVEVSTAGLPQDVDLTWSVNVKGTSVEAPTQEEKMYSMYCPHGLAIDKDPESEYFGRILVADAMNVVKDKTGYLGSGIGAGLHVFNPSFTTDSTVYTGGNDFTRIWEANGYQPWRVKISEDGRIFVSSLDLNGVAVWEVSKDLQTWTPVIAGTQGEDGNILDAEGNFVAGMNVSMDVKGSGEDLTLLLYSCTTGAAAFSQSAFRLDEYALGTDTTWTGTPKNILTGGKYALVHTNAEFIYDGEGGYWFGASRAGNAGQPNLVHINAAGEQDYYTEDAGLYGGDGVLVHNGMLFKGKARTSSTVGNFGVWTIGKDEAGKVTLTEKWTVAANGIGRNLNEFAVDYAENLYVVGNSGEKIIAYALPYSGEVSTPAASKYAFTLESEPEYMVIEDEITNLVIDSESMAIIGGPSTKWQVEVYLGLGQDNGDGTITLTEESSVAIMGFDARFIDGYVYDIDADAPAVKAVLHVEDNGSLLEIKLDMTNTPQEAIVVVIEDATVVVDEFEPFPGAMKEYSLKMTANWTDTTDNTTYPVLVEVPVYDPEATEPSEMTCTVTIGGEGDDDPWLGFVEGPLTITTVDGVVTAKGIVANPYTGVAFDVTISGKLPVEEPVKYTVTATVNPAETGTVTGAGEYEEGAEATLTATAAEGYEFVNWTVAGAEVATTATYTFTVTADVEVVANFKEITDAVDNIQVGVQATKVLRNGQLIIIKNDVEYNAQGAVVK